MRFLLSSICILLFFGCGSYPKKQKYDSETLKVPEVVNPYFSDITKDYVYKANIDAFDKFFGGILIIKKIAARHHRIIFTTEVGNTIFDFELESESFKVNRILPEMDRKLLKNILKQDFLALIEENPKTLKSYSKDDFSLIEAELLTKKHFYRFRKDVLQEIIRTSGGKEKVTFQFSRINDNIARAILISHKKLNLKITLKAI